MVARGRRKDVHVDSGEESHHPSDVTMENDRFVHWENRTNPSTSNPAVIERVTPNFETKSDAQHASQ